MNLIISNQMCQWIIYLSIVVCSFLDNILNRAYHTVHFHKIHIHFYILNHVRYADRIQLVLNACLYFGFVNCYILILNHSWWRKKKCVYEVGKTLAEKQFNLNINTSVTICLLSPVQCHCKAFLLGYILCLFLRLTVNADKQIWLNKM